MKIFNFKQTICATVLFYVISFAAFAGHWDYRGNVGLEGRGFVYTPDYAAQNTSRVTGSASVNPEVSYEFNADNRFLFNVFARYDSVDDNRTHYDIRESNYLYIGEDFEITLGISKVFWGVTESRHLIDIINQTDFVDNLNGEEKLGQAMVRVTLLRKWGTLGLFVLPGFRERQFPHSGARLSGPVKIDTDNSTFQSGSKESHVDFALRWTKTLDAWDVGLALFRGTNREPYLTFNSTNNTLVPHYDQIDQVSLDAQYTGETILWKLESIYQWGSDDSFLAFVGGFEYTFYGVKESSVDVGMIVEYLYDDRNFQFSPATNANDDIAAGVRIALNDTQDTQFLAVAMMDNSDQTTFLNIEAERRLGNAWKIALQGSFFLNVASDDAFSFIKNDDHITANLSYYF